jgi:signal transduction histidine kinase
VVRHLRWNAFGLRGRIVGAVLVTAVATLLVAALALLPRLETSLRSAAYLTLKHDVAHASTEINRFDSTRYVYAKDRKALRGALSRLQTRLGATDVTVIGYVDALGHSQWLLSSNDLDQAPATPAVFPDVARAFHTGRQLFSFDTGNGQYVRAAIPLPHADAVLSVYQSIGQIPAAVRAVRRSFEIAALVGLGLTLLLAIPLAARLVRRLRTLRQAALRVAVEGTSAEFPVDRARDEVGDLARSFSIMQRRLRQQEEARRAFVATASHELRTPLASLDGMLELLADDLREGALDLEDAAALLERARVQSRRLGRLAADLLDLSRLDADTQVRSEPVELCELSRAVVAEFELSSLERGVTVALEDGRGAVWAMADPGSVARILRILLDNALRVAPRGSQVSVELGAAPEPCVSVRDQGPGVPAEERTLIFERFKRGRDTGGEAGFGLGLAIGRELAQRMSGTLVLRDSDGPGATFSLTLPPAEAPVEESVPAASLA